MMDDLPKAAHDALVAYDAFMAGESMSVADLEAAKSVSTASIYAAAAYDAAAGGAEAHSLARAFLLALVDPAKEELDYLRADPAAGKVAREAQARLMNMISESPNA